MLGKLLERHDVTEELTVRSRFGFMAYHGGTLEKTTDPIAREAAELAGASYYGVVQADEQPQRGDRVAVGGAVQQPGA